MLITQDHGDKRPLQFRKQGEKGGRKKVCFLEYYGMKYTVGSQNSFPWMFKTKYA